MKRIKNRADKSPIGKDPTGKLPTAKEPPEDRFHTRCTSSGYLIAAFASPSISGRRIGKPINRHIVSKALTDGRV